MYFLQTRPIGIGDELTDHYGRKCSSELLLHYGFILDEARASTPIPRSTYQHSAMVLEHAYNTTASCSAMVWPMACNCGPWRYCMGFGTRAWAMVAMGAIAWAMVAGPIMSHLVPRNNHEQ